MADKTLNITIDEGTIHLMFAAYRLGKCDPVAPLPKNLPAVCVKMMQAKTLEEKQAAMAVLAAQKED